MKYIVFKFIGAELPVLFPGNIFNYDNIKVLSAEFGDGRAVSAGVCKIDGTGKVTVWGDSFSLNLESRKKDAVLIEQAFKE